MDNPPNLTTMTMTTVIPSDTYSEYMATYTPEETYETDESRYSYSRPEGYGADTAFRGTRDTAAGYRDTAATAASSKKSKATAITEESTFRLSTEVPSSFSETVTETAAPVAEGEYTETAAPVTERGFTYTRPTADRPQRDTMMSGGFTRDTMHSAERPEKITETTAGGTENAN